ncbi:antitoxin [Thermithiobacillus plumbiphilus]|uniref:Antitoxin n=1 Tax=Thermithiobacillus plumbiphilus TaxID=1729899 RepID=A0ABU9D8F0_9PROT
MIETGRQIWVKKIAQAPIRYIILIHINGGFCMDIAKVFWTGRSQAVRLPKDFRFDADTVRIRRHGNAVILEPIAKDWAWLDAIIGSLDADFVQAAGEQPDPQDRPGLDSLFR